MPYPIGEIRMKSSNSSSGVDMLAVIPGVERGGTAKIDKEGKEELAKDNRL